MKMSCERFLSILLGSLLGATATITYVFLWYRHVPHCVSATGVAVVASVGTMAILVSLVSLIHDVLTGDRCRRTAQQCTACTACKMSDDDENDVAVQPLLFTASPV